MRFQPSLAGVAAPRAQQCSGSLRSRTVFCEWLAGLCTAWRLGRWSDGRAVPDAEGEFDSLRATHKASSTSGRELTQLRGQCRGRTHVPMALCQPRRRELSAGIATNRQADRFTRMAHDTGAWKLNADAQRAVGPTHGLAEGTIGSLGADLSLKMTPRAEAHQGEEMIVDVNEIERCLRYFKEVNAADLADIEWTRGGEPLAVDPAMLEEFAFIGLSNRDFPAIAGWLPDGIGIKVTSLLLTKAK